MLAMSDRITTRISKRITRQWAALCALALIQAACAATLQPGDGIDLSGRFALRGNEPFIHAVVYDARGVFELEGLTREQAISLQNRQVKVHGIVTRADMQGAQLPAVRVESLRTVSPAASSTRPSNAPAQ
jgi:hypothetical protein